jgi:hypothetical protein
MRYRTFHLGTGASNSPRSHRSGHAAVEIALLSPWILLLFMAIFDFGFYAYAAICTQNAARIAALATSAAPGNAGSQPTGCTLALEEMRMLPNIAALATTYPCTALPLIVNVTSFADPETSPRLGSRVEVTYQSVQLFPLPFLMGRMTLTRVAEMRVFGE